MERFLALPGGSGRLVLVPTNDGYCQSLVAERMDGSTGWRANPPGGDEDAWVAVSIDGGTVLANSYSGWLVRFDPESGHEVERHFTK